MPGFPAATPKIASEIATQVQWRQFFVDLQYQRLTKS
jgi:hypothetical protein